MRKITLKAARVDAKYTQQELANALKVNVSTIKRWEKGKMIPSIENEDRLIATLRRDRDEILFPYRRKEKK